MRAFSESIRAMRHGSEGDSSREGISSIFLTNLAGGVAFALGPADLTRNLKASSGSMSRPLDGEKGMTTAEERGRTQLQTPDRSLEEPGPARGLEEGLHAANTQASAGRRMPDAGPAHGLEETQGG